ncbi:MAG: aldehyde dehydrogenase [Pseudonocardia sp.]|nr:aldehyde dehydrogenase [Pseudonocardia sp.]MBO0872393.1 aldehyde dehydrogenase [Pseudonocardia sp.]
MVSAESGTQRLDRRVFVTELLAGAPDALVVTGLGSASYDVYAAGDRDENFYLWGAMGAAVPVGLGVALAQPNRSVVVVTGDGEQLMGLGSLATVGARRPANLTVVVLDNGHYGETGMQQSHTSRGTDLVAVARGCGIADAFLVSEPRQVRCVLGRIGARSGPTFAQVLISAEEPPRALPPRDGVFVKNRFRAGLGLPTF